MLQLWMATVCAASTTGIDFAFGDLGVHTAGHTPASCCALCESTAACKLWVLETDTTCAGCCYMKAAVSCEDCELVPKGSPCTRPHASRIAGNWTCAPTLSPTPAPPAGPPLPAPVSQLSARFRNWSYFIGDHDGFVIPPLAGNFSGQMKTDTAVVFEKTPDDTLPGRWRMTYLFYNGTAGGNGYETAFATSDDLLHWSYGAGGEYGTGMALKRSAVPGTYDYGGVTLGGMLYTTSDMRAPRRLRKINGSYWALYGCYDSRSGYCTRRDTEGKASRSHR